MLTNYTKAFSVSRVEAILNGYLEYVLMGTVSPGCAISSMGTRRFPELGTT